MDILVDTDDEELEANIECKGDDVLNFLVGSMSSNFEEDSSDEEPL